MINRLKGFAGSIGEIRDGVRDPPQENDALFVGDGGDCFDHSLRRLLAQQRDKGCARLGPPKASEGTSGGMPDVRVKVSHKLKENGNYRRRCADASASAGANVGIGMPQEVKPDVGRQICTEVHGSRDCRDRGIE